MYEPCSGTSKLRPSPQTQFDLQKAYDDMQRNFKIKEKEAADAKSALQQEKDIGLRLNQDLRSSLEAEVKRERSVSQQRVAQIEVEAQNAIKTAQN